MTSRTSVWEPKPRATPTMPAPVRAGEMSTLNSLRIISVAITQDDHGGDVGEHRAQGPGPLRPLQRIEPGSEIDVVLEALHADADDPDDREGKGERPAAREGPEPNIQVLSVRR